jgi:glycosyltransferase involved in cell wall biosynthesis
MSMRIVHLGKFYHPHRGGIETHVRALAQLQAKRGDEIHVVCLAHDQAPSADFWDGPVFVKRFAPRVRFAKVDWVPEIARYLDDLSCDILHVHVPNPTMTMAVLPLRRTPPIAITYHSEVVGMPVRKWLFQPWERRLLQRARVIAATNPRMVQASARLQPHQDRVRVVPLGLPLERFAAPRPRIEQRAREIRTEFGQPLWLMCGRLVSYKGHAVALEALTQTPGTLAIIGEGPLRSSLETQVRRLRLDHRVRFLGSIACDEEVAAFYRAATALWLPSTLPSEAFGLVQVEAMASGCPVINTDIPGSGVPWVSRHEETGLTAPTHDAAAIAQLSRRLVEEPGLRDRLGQAARARALAEFDQPLMGERWQALYDEMLSPAAWTTTAPQVA